MSVPPSRAFVPDARQRPLRIGFLSAHNPFDRSAFSGTAFHMHRALAAVPGISVRVLGGHAPPPWHDRLSRRFRPAPRVDAAAIGTEGLDAVLGLVATGLLAALAPRTRVPLVHVTDATPAFLRDSYGWAVPREADLAEARAIAAARLVVYSSPHMADRAQAEFGPIPARVAAIPFGTNCETPPATMPAKTGTGPLRLLWVGSDWTRKGGAIALAAFDTLRAAGRDVRLTLVGDVPGGLAPRPGLEVAGWLDKRRPRAAARLAQLFAEAHLFLLPTRADCTPMVIAEANAQGTPVLATDVGGVGALVAEGRSGRLLPAAADAAAWARAAEEMTADRAAHAALCRSSFEHARTRLTWEAWAREIAALLRAEVAGAVPLRAAA